MYSFFGYLAPMTAQTNKLWALTGFSMFIILFVVLFVVVACLRVLARRRRPCRSRSGSLRNELLALVFVVCAFLVACLFASFVGLKRRALYGLPLCGQVRLDFLQRQLLFARPSNKCVCVCPLAHCWGGGPPGAHEHRHRGARSGTSAPADR